MNEELFLLFCEMNSASRTALDHAFSKSPKMLQLIDFLEKSERPFKTPKAINIVYSEELDTVAYPKLINRFYKLRQQLIEWLYHYLKKTENYSSKEEQSLNFIRYLVNKNQFKNALDKAIKLEKHCRKLNLFELLPGVLNMIIYARQCAFLGGDKVLIEAEERLLEAIEWHQILEKLHYYHQRSYRVTNEEDYQQILKAVRKLIAPYKHLPRFVLLYHYIAFSKGCMILGNVKKATNALVRHLNKLEAILKENPKMPMVFAKAYYTQIDPYNLLLLKAVFYFVRGQFNDAAQALKERDRIETANPHLPYPISEAQIRNTITILIVSKQYRLALKKWDQLVAFYKKHEQEERLDLALLEKTNIYFFQYPKVHKKDLLDLYEDLSALNNPEFESSMNVARIFMQLLLGKVITKEQLERGRSLIEAYGITIELIQELNEAFLQRNASVLQRIIHKLEDKLTQKNNAIQLMYYQQFLVITKKNYGMLV